MNRIVLADNMDYLPGLPSESVDLIYVDPPFNTGKKQARTRIRTERDEENGDRVGFQGKRYKTVVPTNGKERTGYPTQKPMGILTRIVRVHSRPGDLLLDFFAGSGTLGEAAARAGREFILVDNNPDAAGIMARRLAFADSEHVGFAPTDLPGTQTSLLASS